MRMAPNYVVSFMAAAFLIYSYVQITVKKAEVHNGCLHGIVVIIAVLLLGMSLYGIVCAIPLGEVQLQIERSFR